MLLLIRRFRRRPDRLAEAESSRPQTSIDRRWRCEGGPTLLTQMAAADLIDEYDITLAPILAGNGHGIVDGPLGEIKRLHLAQAIADDGFVFTKYVRLPASAPAGRDQEEAQQE